MTFCMTSRRSCTSSVKRFLVITDFIIPASLFAASSPPPQATRAAERRTLKHNRRMLATSTAGTILGELRRDLRKPAAERPRKKKSTRKKFDAAAALKYASAKKVSRPYAYATEKDIPVPSFVDVDDSTTAHNLEDSFSMYRLQVKEFESKLVQGAPRKFIHRVKTFCNDLIAHSEYDKSNGTQVDHCQRLVAERIIQISAWKAQKVEERQRRMSVLFSNTQEFPGVSKIVYVAYISGLCKLSKEASSDQRTRMAVKAADVLDEMLRTGSNPDSSLVTLVVRMFTSSGKVDSALNLLSQISRQRRKRKVDDGVDHIEQPRLTVHMLASILKSLRQIEKRTPETSPFSSQLKEMLAAIQADQNEMMNVLQVPPKKQPNDGQFPET